MYRNEKNGESKKGVRRLTPMGVGGYNLTGPYPLQRGVLLNFT